jgi:hypothetical protein
MRLRTIVVAATTVLPAGTASAQTPQGSGFTYQGRLADAGSPADGAFDFQFILYDAAVGGSQIGPIVLRDDVVVTAGLFTVGLDFGASFGGSRRWLDIAVRPGASTGTFTPVVPRQELSSAPNALFSAATTWAGVAAKPAGFADNTDDDVVGGLTCGGGQVAKWNGNTWACAADLVNPGTVTSIAAGAGLTGGPITSAGTLGVAFGGGGQASTVARSDHNHHGQTWNAASLTGLTIESAATGGTGLLGRAGAGGGISRGVVGESTATAGVGVYGHAISTTSAAAGVYGLSDSSQGLGVYGEGGEFGMRGQSNSTYGVGVFGWHTGTAGLTYGVRGWNQSTFGRGVAGAALATSGDARGVEGQTNSTQGTGVYGWATSTAGGPTIGVVGRSESTGGRGVVGYSLATSGSTTGVWGETWSTAGRAVQGRAYGGDGAIVGVYGWAQSSTATGVYGEANWPSGSTIGVHGVSDSSQGRAVFGNATATAGSAIGIRGSAASSSGYGVYANVSATTGTHYGIFGQASATSGYAGYFSGRVTVNGTLAKSAGSFKIDHPLDPERKYLYHSFVESPDMKNVYDGVVTTDGDGFATVRLPEWFEALNRDFRYQITVLGDGAWARARVFRKIADNAFVVQTDLPQVEVSWQVTGIRHDRYAEAHRIPLEEDKPVEEQGTYLSPDAWGVPAERGLDHRHAAANP